MGLLDYPQTSWVVHDVVKKLRRQPNHELAPVFYKFFPLPDAEVRMKSQYLHLRCKICGRFETDPMFGIGFDEPITVRFKQDMGLTNDRLFIINDKCLQVLKDGKVGGYETKPIGKSGWHALRPTLLVDTVPGLKRDIGPNCPECGRPEDSSGISIWRERDVEVPSQSGTIFSTKISAAGFLFKDRDIFFTEDVYQVLKAGKIKGPYCERLQTEEEIAKRHEKEKQGIHWLPPGMTKYLSGK